MLPELKISNNAEIDEALREFEEKSQSIPQADISHSVGGIDETPKMVKMVMRFSGGAIKEQRQAEYVLLGFVVVVVAVSLYLFFGGDDKKSQISPQLLEQMKQMQNLTPNTKSQ